MSRNNNDDKLQVNNATDDSHDWNDPETAMTSSLKSIESQPTDIQHNSPSQSNASTSSSASSSGSMSIVAQSPPRFVNLDDIDRAASGVSNMFLSHQIAMDKNFRLQRTDPTDEPNSLRHQVMSALKQAFWDILQSQLNELPTNFKQALQLLSTIKQDLCSLLLSPQGKLRQEIDEILDLELIKQQAEHGALDFQRYAQYVLSVMARLCAPVRDEQIRQLTQSSDVIELFKGIVELIELMKLDMANFTISQMRPHIVQHSVEYERQKFNEFLEMQSKMGCDGLTNTRHWLKSTCDEYDESSIVDQDRNKSIDQVIRCAYVRLLKNHNSIGVFPETLAIDQDVILVLRQKLHTCILTGSALLIVGAAIPTLQSNSELKQRLKQHLLLLLNNAGSNRTTDLDQLTGVADYMISELTKSIDLSQSLTDDKVTSLKQQLVDLANPDNRVRTVIQRRVSEFVEQALSSKSGNQLQIPTGLNVLQDELMELVGCLIKVVSFNMSVFGDQYAKLVDNYLAK